MNQKKDLGPRLLGREYSSIFPSTYCRLNKAPCAVEPIVLDDSFVWWCPQTQRITRLFPMKLPHIYIYNVLMYYIMSINWGNSQFLQNENAQTKAKFLVLFIEWVELLDFFLTAVQLAPCAAVSTVSNNFRKSYERWIWYDVQMMWYRAVGPPWLMGYDRPCGPAIFIPLLLGFEPSKPESHSCSAAFGSPRQCDLRVAIMGQFSLPIHVSCVRSTIRSNSKDRRDCHWLPIRPWLRHPMTWWLFQSLITWLQCFLMDFDLSSTN
jgi:hypothetical protein